MLDMVNVLTVTCGEFEFDAVIPNLIHYVILGIQIFIPVVLIILGMVDLGRAVMSNDDKAMKEKQNLLIKRIIYAVLIFLVVAIVRTVFSIVGKVDDSDASGGASKATSCINCFVNGADKCDK